MRLDFLDPLPGYYTSRQFAEIIGVSYITVQHWVEDGRINAFRIGKTMAIPGDEIDKVNGNLNNNSKRRERAARVREIMAADNVCRTTAYRYLATGHRKL